MNSGANVYVQEEVEKYARTFVEFPPMQRGASFNMEAVKEQILRAMQAQTDPLASWNDGAAKQAVIEFVAGDQRQASQTT